jgi:hypothetical protein
MSGGPSALRLTPTARLNARASPWCLQGPARVETVPCASLAVEASSAPTHGVYPSPGVLSSLVAPHPSSWSGRAPTRFG